MNAHFDLKILNKLKVFNKTEETFRIDARENNHVYWNAFSVENVFEWLGKIQAK